MDGLKRKRRTVAMRLEKQPDDIREGFVQLGNTSMLWTSGRELGAAALDDTRIAAETALW